MSKAGAGYLGKDADKDGIIRSGYVLGPQVDKVTLLDITKILQFRLPPGSVAGAGEITLRLSSGGKLPCVVSSVKDCVLCCLSVEIVRAVCAGAVFLVDVIGPQGVHTYEYPVRFWFSEYIPQGLL